MKLSSEDWFALRCAVDANLSNIPSLPLYAEQRERILTYVTREHHAALMREADKAREQV